MNLQGHRNDAGESRPVALPLVCLDYAGVWLSCQLSHYLDFSSCGIVPGFCKSGHIYGMTIVGITLLSLEAS